MRFTDIASKSTKGKIIKARRDWPRYTGYRYSSKQSTALNDIKGSAQVIVGCIGVSKSTDGTKDI